MIHRPQHCLFSLRSRLPFFSGCAGDKGDTRMAAACAAVLNDDEPEPLRPQKTCYEVNGVTLSVDGLRL